MLRVFGLDGNQSKCLLKTLLKSPSILAQVEPVLVPRHRGIDKNTYISVQENLFMSAHVRTLRNPREVHSVIKLTD